MNASWNGDSSIASYDITNRDGEFSLVLDNRILERISRFNVNSKNEKIKLLFHYKEFEFSKYILLSDINKPVTLELDTLFANNYVKIFHQPLRSKNSIATFDLAVYNTGNTNCEIGFIHLELKVTEEDCKQYMQGNINDISNVIVLDLDNSTSEIISDEPIIEKINFRPYNLNLCAKVDILQEFTIKSNDVERFRIDIQSKEIRRDFNEYSIGNGPYGSFNETDGHIYQNTPRLKKEDLRYYYVEATIYFNPITDKYPYGKYHLIEKMEIGKFLERDKKTIISD